MKILINTVKMLLSILVYKESKGRAIKKFCEESGLVYTKLAQILSMQSIDILNISSDDTKELSSICNKTNKMSWEKIYDIIDKEYTELFGAGSWVWDCERDWRKTSVSGIKHINRKPIGYASISQVHRGVIIDADGGEKEVVFKIKRPDIEKSIEDDIRTIKRLSKYLGWLVGFKNWRGAEKALDFEIKWIRQELDFENEVMNIETYRDFANSVNGKLENCTSIVIPKVYTELCTKNVIVMEYIDNDFIVRNMEEKNRKQGEKLGRDTEIYSRTDKKILNALNDYIRLSFNALLNGDKVAFHGDPHTGNIYIDESGNIGFIDMGLVFTLDKYEAEKTKQLFLCLWFNRKEKLFNLLKGSFKGNGKQLMNFRAELYDYMDTIQSKPLTNYFMDLVLICFRYEMVPDDYLFSMAKAFACLGGISETYKNEVAGRELLKEQITRYIVQSKAEMIKNGIGKITDWAKGKCDAEDMLVRIIMDMGDIIRV